MELKSRKENFIGRAFLYILVILGTCHYCHSFCIPGADPASPTITQGSAKTGDVTKRLCPDGSAFHNGTSMCHKLLEKGPCGDLQLFYALSKDSEYGACHCMSNDNGCDPIVKSNRMILPGPDGKQCFWAYSSGPCPDGQWYVLNLKSLKPECQKNACYNEDGLRKQDPLVGKDEVVLGMGQAETDKFTFVLNNTCYETYTKAYCPENEYVQFLGTNTPYPKCYKVTKGPSCSFGIFGVAPVVGMPCEAGYKHVGDDCVLADIEFD